MTDRKSNADASGPSRGVNGPGDIVCQAPPTPDLGALHSFGGPGGRTAAQLRQLAFDTLEKVCQVGGRGALARTSAAKALLDATEPDYRKTLLQLFKGDRVKLRAFLEAELAALQDQGHNPD